MTVQLLRRNPQAAYPTVSKQAIQTMCHHGPICRANTFVVLPPLSTILEGGTIFSELPLLNSFQSMQFWFQFPHPPKIPWTKTTDTSVHPRDLLFLRELTLFPSFKQENTRNITILCHTHHKFPHKWK